MIRFILVALCSVSSAAFAEPTKDTVTSSHEKSDSTSYDKSDSTAEATDGAKPSSRKIEYTLIGMDRHEYLLGGLTGTVFGFGIGHGVQGRWLRDGWVFTAGEILTSAAVIASISPCKDELFKTGAISLSDRLAKCNKVGLVLGQLSFITFRIWETVDAWVAPNPTLKEAIFGSRRANKSLELGYIPAFDQGLGSLSLAYRF